MMWQSHILFQRECKREESNQQFYGNRYTGKVDCSPNGEESKKDKYHTDKELAKMAGVGTGTIARYDAIMKRNIKAIGTVKIPVAFIKLCGEIF